MQAFYPTRTADKHRIAGLLLTTANPSVYGRLGCRNERLHFHLALSDNVRPRR